jgi:heme exporter protein CcmD
MTYLGYVIAAYAVFAVVLAWDFLAPRLAIARQLRAARRLAARRAAPPSPPHPSTERGR